MTDVSWAPNRQRRQRLVNFYSEIKGLERKHSQNVVESEERKEAAFIIKNSPWTRCNF
jgi:hypothetical protein